MPQGRRKIPYSSKQKKLQLQAKRQQKSGQRRDEDTVESSSSSHQTDISRINEQPVNCGAKSNPNRYVLQFRRESEAEIRERKELATQTIETLPPEETEVDMDEYFPSGLEFPKRPPWSFEMSRQSLDVRENEYFKEYISTLREKFNWDELSYFELNLETWRQLWRVLEMSDIILIIVDIRFPALMFPPSLYTYIVEKTGKEMILVLNKVDLAPAPLVVAWKHYFQTKFPSLHILTFTSFPSYNLHGNVEGKSGFKNAKRKGRLRMSAEGAQKLLETCQRIVGENVDLESWKNKIADEMMTIYENEELEVGEVLQTPNIDTTYHEHVKYRDGILTIGCIGQPNVGKSSLMNAVMGKKVVSVSKTPGHTKHFQTIFLTPTVKFCDCPGLVFPSKVPKTLQILMGSYPIAQVREPYTTIRYLAERIDLVGLLRIQHPDNDNTWSAIDICDGWAKARGFFAARSGRADTYRAANHLLRMALDGKICLCLRPVGFTNQEDYWKNHPDVNETVWIQAQKSHASHSNQILRISSSSDDENDECEVRVNPKSRFKNTSKDSDEESVHSQEETR